MMTRLLVVGALVGALAVPAALAADPVPADFKNAAKYCKAVRTSKGVEAFATQYGTNKNKKNAFGTCVLSTAKAKAEKREAADDAAEEKATGLQEEAGRERGEVCSGLQDFGQCVKAEKSD